MAHDETTVVVHCLSGPTYADRPTSFESHGEHYVVSSIESLRRVLDRTSGAVTTEFGVTTEDGRRFCLSYEEAADRWTIELQGER